MNSNGVGYNAIEFRTGLHFHYEYLDYELEFLNKLRDRGEGNLIGYQIYAPIDDILIKQWTEQNYLNGCGNCDGTKNNCKYHGCSVWYKVDHENMEIHLGYHSCETIGKHNEETVIKYRYKQSGLPYQYYEKTAKDFNAAGNAKVLKALKLFADKKNSIFIYGDIGTGKTLAVSLIGKKLVKDNTNVLFTTVPEMMIKLKSSIATSETATIVAQYNNADLIILDDIGAEMSSEWGLEQLFIIVNSRYNANKPICFTSNYSIDQLKQLWCKYTICARLISRMRAMCIEAKTAINESRRQ